MELFHKAINCYVSYVDVIAKTKVRQVFNKEVHFELFRENQKPPFKDLCGGLRTA
jgi:hypothetical protein